MIKIKKISNENKQKYVNKIFFYIKCIHTRAFKIINMCVCIFSNLIKNALKNFSTANLTY